jgi:hypothetical protein
MIVIDEDTKAAHLATLDTALAELKYGAIAVNTIPASYIKKRPFDRLMAANAQFMMRPTWANLNRTMSSAMRANMSRKDF